MRRAEPAESHARRAVLKAAGAAAASLLCPSAVRAATSGPHSPWFSDGALRFDFRHSVARSEESFSLQRLRLESAWPGPSSRGRTDMGWGDYRLSVFDPGGAALLYRCGFDTPVEPGAASSTAEISVRCPMPQRPVRAVLEHRRPSDLFQARWEARVDPADAAIVRSAIELDARVDRIQTNGAPGAKVDLAILGDGYLAAEYDKFRASAHRAAAYLFGVEPFARRARDFNVVSVFVPSASSGVTDPYLGIRKNTALRASYFSGAAERTLSVRDNRALREAASHVPYDFLLVLAHSRRYGASATFGGAAVVAIDSAAARYLVVHELAHVIGGLADEYYVPEAGGPVYAGNVEPWNPNVTISPRLGKWRHLAPDAAIGATRWNKAEYDAYMSSYVRRYLALRSAHADEAAVERLMREAEKRMALLLSKGGEPRARGWFEGANGYSRGVYRAEADCIMFSYQTRHFCAACAAAIERAIDAHCGR